MPLQMLKKEREKDACYESGRELSEVACSHFGDHSNWGKTPLSNSSGVEERGLQVNKSGSFQEWHRALTPPIPAPKAERGTKAPCHLGRSSQGSVLLDFLEAGRKFSEVSLYFPSP